MSTKASASDRAPEPGRSEGASFDKSGSYFSLGSVGRIAPSVALAAQRNLAAIATEMFPGPGDGTPSAEGEAWYREVLDGLGLRQCTCCGPVLTQ